MRVCRCGQDLVRACVCVCVRLCVRAVSMFVCRQRSNSSIQQEM